MFVESPRRRLARNMVISVHTAGAGAAGTVRRRSQLQYQQMSSAGNIRKLRSENLKQQQVPIARQSIRGAVRPSRVTAAVICFREFSREVGLQPKWRR